MEMYLSQDKKGEFYFHISKQQTLMFKLNRRQDQWQDDPAGGRMFFYNHEESDKETGEAYLKFFIVDKWDSSKSNL